MLHISTHLNKNVFDLVQKFNFFITICVLNSNFSALHFAFTLLFYDAAWKDKISGKNDAELEEPEESPELQMNFDDFSNIIQALKDRQKGKLFLSVTFHKMFCFL